MFTLIVNKVYDYIPTSRRHSLGHSLYFNLAEVKKGQCDIWYKSINTRRDPALKRLT